MRSAILAEVYALPAEESDTVFLGSWSVKDLLAHLAGWDYANLEAAKSVLRGRVPEFYAYHDRDWQTYNAMLVKKYGRDFFGEQIALTRDSQGQLLEYLQTIPPESFNKDFGVRFRGYKVTIQRLLEAETKDERIHYQQIQDYFVQGREHHPAP